jgi:hypothetical protein
MHRVTIVTVAINGSKNSVLAEPAFSDDRMTVNANCTEDLFQWSSGLQVPSMNEWEWVSRGKSAGKAVALNCRQNSAVRADHPWNTEEANTSTAPVPADV